MASNLATAAAVSMAKHGTIAVNHVTAAAATANVANTIKNTVNSARNTVVNTVARNTVVPTSTFSIQHMVNSITTAVPWIPYWFILVWILVLLLFVTLYYYIDIQQWSLSKWFADREDGVVGGWDWKRWWRPREEDTDRAAIRQEEREIDRGRDVGRPTPHKPWNKNESWCFVGEDLTGRACVKVPSPMSCDSERIFGSRSDCELQTANAMPSGVIKNGGTSMIPLASMGRML